ncbi:hypothetical protein L6250_01080 [Candidatus Parcubacteria bacterium]|nr:hypothetical protein [Patescibacteria group bacterium]MBU4466532.1 hypothetical protein [Patescibacteria group bacterium]MCG2688214.1 hypothetical protein [Candidatus Parcubacteria bacterium]
MKKYILLIVFLTVSLVVFPNLVLAADCNAGPPPCPGGSFCIPNPLKYASFECLVDAIVSFLFTASLLLAPIMVLIGAFTLMTAAGNPAKVKTANNIFIYTGIGLLIVFMGKGLVSAIKALMGG